MLDPNQKQQTRVIFQGVGSQLERNGDNGTNNGGDKGCLIQAKDTLGCMVCIDGYYYFNGICKIKTPVCLKFNTLNNRCESCHNTFNLVNGECLDLNCEDYLYAQCAKCKQGFSISEEGYCFDPNCGTKSQGICTKCLLGYVLDQSSKLCYKSIDGCSVYNA